MLVPQIVIHLSFCRCAVIHYEHYQESLIYRKENLSSWLSRILLTANLGLIFVSARQTPGNSGKTTNMERSEPGYVDETS